MIKANPMRLFIYSRLNSTGVGRHAENFYHALTELVSTEIEIIVVNPDDLEATARMIVEATSSNIALFFKRPHKLVIEKLKCRKILWFAFEPSVIPKLLREELSQYDRIWAPSQWGYDILVQNGLAPAKLDVVPEGVNSALYLPAPTPHRGFIFLNIGKYEKRKGLDELIEAFSSEFPINSYPEISLWLKADYPSIPERIPMLCAKIEHDSRIKLIGGDYPESEILRLYQCADAFVFPSRAEGFGLPALEAAACSVPLIALPYSGQTEYLATIKDLYQPIDYTLVPIDDEDYRHFYKDIYDESGFGVWAEPDIPSLRQSMREVYNNHSLWRERGNAASRILREQFDWSRIARIALDKIKAMSAQN